MYIDAIIEKYMIRIPCYWINDILLIVHKVENKHEDCYNNSKLAFDLKVASVWNQ